MLNICNKNEMFQVSKLTSTIKPVMSCIYISPDKIEIYVEEYKTYTNQRIMLWISL